MADDQGFDQLQESFARFEVSGQVGSVRDGRVRRWPTSTTARNTYRLPAISMASTASVPETAAMIDRLALESPVDELMIRRLKKRRLGLRDQIARLTLLLDPKEPA